MSDVSIRVEGLCKQYRISGQTAPYFTLRDSFSELGARIFRLFSPNGQSNSEPASFWALRNVSFEAKQGEAVGIIGRNGAGKTTLLKILSRITDPTQGRAEIRGRVASLLEVGTGFHLELTGRENTYLNGAILGMKKAEIDRKFDEIVDFSGVERFIDTPVKYYSSGMHVRLAFAVAAHLEPEILLVDEVLAVGDLSFQKKCLGKMQDVTGGGRTVLFVSHNLGAIRDLCPRTVWLDEGQMLEDGPSATVCTNYMVFGQDVAGDIDLTVPSIRQGSSAESRFRWMRMKIENSQGKSTPYISLREPFEIVLSGLASSPIEEVVFSVSVLAGGGAGYLFGSLQTDSKLPTSYPAGLVAFRVRFDPNMFGPGVLTVDINAHGLNVHDRIPAAARIYLDPSSDTVRPDQRGMMLCPCTWSLDQQAF